ncbi:hypothetical protein [Desulfonema magnum]|uniref:hypothetical protein n=1 Tax=Desulfonema magnum TaxID=45655 RepID=UPI001A9B6F8E|nr:hypothetical protein [Desulfonema magnum]
MDEKYIGYLESVFQNVFISPKVFDEINENKYKNLSDENAISDIDTIIYSKIHKFVTNEDTEECCEIVKNATGYFKKNGEFYSVALALCLSRMEGNDFNEKILKVHFVTDDDGAKEDFSYFFKISQIGQILDSIDIVTLFYLKGHIAKKELSDFCISLKSLYNRKMAILVRETERIRGRQEESILRHFLSEILELLNTGETEELKKIKTHRNFTRVKRKEKKFNKLFEEFLKSDIGQKIEQIEKRRKNIEYIWKI